MAAHATKEGLAEAKSIPSNTLCRKYAKVQLVDPVILITGSKDSCFGLQKGMLSV